MKNIHVVTFIVTLTIGCIVIVQQNIFGRRSNIAFYNKRLVQNGFDNNDNARRNFNIETFDHASMLGRKMLDNKIVEDERLTNIPKVIHQTWKTKQTPRWARLPIKSWKRLNPEFKYKLYDDNDMEKYVKKYFPKILKFYKNDMKPVQRADVFRYIVIYAEGGIYADIDTTCAVPIHKWLTYTENITKSAPSLVINNEEMKNNVRYNNNKINFIVGFEAIQRKPGWEKFFAAEFQLCQWTFGASKKHWLLKNVLDRIFEYYKNGKHLKSKSIIKSTGPGIWSYAMNDAFKTRYNVTFGREPFNHEILGKHGAKVGEDILVLPTSSFGRPFGGIGSSDHVLIWHGFQGSWKPTPFKFQTQIAKEGKKLRNTNAIYDAVLNN